MVRSGLLAGVLALAGANWAEGQVVCCGPHGEARALIVDVVAIRSSVYPDPGRQRRSHLDWAQTINPDEWDWYGRYTQFRVVQHISGESDRVITVAHGASDFNCSGCPWFRRGERYLLALRREGEHWVFNPIYSASGENRRRILQSGDFFGIDGHVHHFWEGEGVEATVMLRPLPPPNGQPEPLVLPELLYPATPERVGYSVLDDHVHTRQDAEE